MSKVQIRVNSWNPTAEVQLPAGWLWTTVGDVADDTQIGIVRSKAQQNRDGKGVPYLKMNNLTMDGKVTSDDIVFVEATQNEIDRFSLRAGDILFNTRNSVELVGKTGIVTGEASGSIYNNNLMRIRTKTDVSSLFVAYQMCSPDFRRRMEKVKRSTTNVAALYAKDVLPLPIALTSIDQQELIVAEIEKQFSRLDEAVANLKRVKANLKRYKAAVLKAAVEGKLTENWRKAHPDVEPASELLKRILAKRRAKWKGKGKYKEPAVPDTANFPELPRGWCWVTLESISEALGGFAFESRKFSTSGYQVLKMANIRMGRIDFSHNPSYIDDVKPETVSKYELKDGDLVVTLTGTRKKRDYGYIAVVKTPKRLLLNQRIARLRTFTDVIPCYLVIAMQSETYQNRFFASETGNVGQGNVGMMAVTKEPVALAPMAEQEQIVAEFERRLSVIDETDAIIVANLQRATRLQQSTLQKAFTGQL